MINAIFDCAYKWRQNNLFTETLKIYILSFRYISHCFLVRDHLLQANLPETWKYLRPRNFSKTVAQLIRVNFFSIRFVFLFFLFYSAESEFRVQTNVGSAELNRAKREWISGLVNSSNFSIRKIRIN